jgi:hypothetical protein
MHRAATQRRTGIRGRAKKVSSGDGSWGCGSWGIIPGDGMMAWQSETEGRFSERWETRIKLNGGAEKLSCLMTGGYLFLGFSST